MDTSERMKKAVVMYYNGKGTTSAPHQGGARTEDNTLSQKANDRRAQYESVSSRGLGPVSDHLC